MDLGRRLPEAHVEVVANETGEPHVEISFGPVCIAFSHVDRPSRPLRNARFRRNRAESNQFLFDFASRPAPGTQLFALLLHGSLGDPYELGFADIVFPIPSDEEEDGICYHPDRIHLVKMFETKTSEREYRQDREPRIRPAPEIG